MRAPVMWLSIGHARRVGIFMLWSVLLSLSPSPAGPQAWAAEPRSTISGTVSRDERRDGRATEQRGVEGVVVELSGEGREERTRTDGRGGYSFDNLKAGTYRVSVVPPRGHEPSANEARTVAVDGRSTYRSLDFGVTPVRPTPSPTATATRAPLSTSTTPARRRGASPTVAAPSPAAAVMQAADGPAEAEPGAPGPESGEPPEDPAPAGDPPPATGTPRPIVASLPLRYAAGRSRAAEIDGWAAGDILSLGVPFRTQLDSTDFALVNCGPASLAMVLAAFGIEVEPAAIRDYVNYLSGDADTGDGTSLDYLARVAREAGLAPLDLYAEDGYRTWSLDRLRTHVQLGHPVVTLTRYQSLPGHAESAVDTDHYIVISGVSGDDFIYNDGAFAGSAGYGLLISGPDLEHAWQASTIPGHAVAYALAGRPAVPAWMAAHPGPAPTPAGEPGVGDESQEPAPADANGPMAEVVPTSSPAPLSQLSPAPLRSTEPAEIAAAEMVRITPAPRPPQASTEVDSPPPSRVHPQEDGASNPKPSPGDSAAIGLAPAVLIGLLLFVVGPGAASRQWAGMRSLAGFVLRRR